MCVDSEALGATLAAVVTEPERLALAEGASAVSAGADEASAGTGAFALVLTCAVFKEPVTPSAWQPPSSHRSRVQLLKHGAANSSAPNSSEKLTRP
jgi:hypothetical protein